MNNAYASVNKRNLLPANPPPPPPDPREIDGNSKLAW